MPLGGSIINFGTGGNDNFCGLSEFQSVILNSFFSSSFGGDGSDNITGSFSADLIIGGKGTDFLDGYKDNDTYIYNKGDGLDFIRDISGSDCLILRGFADSDLIQAMTTEDSDYIDVYCNNEIIVKIDRKHRDKGSLKKFWLQVEKFTSITKTTLDSGLFKPINYIKRMVIACPVDIEIADQNGNIVYTVENAVEGNYYTEYGNFYVFEEENGEYGKVIDLVEGYSVRILGVDDGQLSVAVQDVTESTEQITFVSTDVEITNTTTVTIEQTSEAVTLSVDTDSDGAADEVVLMETVTNTYTEVPDFALTYDEVSFENGVYTFAVTAANNLSVETEAEIYAAVYEDGRFIGIQQKSVLIPALGGTNVEFELNCSQNADIKVFLLDGALAPLSEAIKIS
jgi:hypothetical protein